MVNLIFVYIRSTWQSPQMSCQSNTDVYWTGAEDRGISHFKSFFYAVLSFGGVVGCWWFLLCRAAFCPWLRRREHSHRWWGWEDAEWPCQSISSVVWPLSFILWGIRYVSSSPEDTHHRSFVYLTLLFLVCLHCLCPFFLILHSLVSLLSSVSYSTAPAAVSPHFALFLCICSSAAALPHRSIYCIIASPFVSPQAPAPLSFLFLYFNVGKRQSRKQANSRWVPLGCLYSFIHSIHYPSVLIPCRRGLKPITVSLSEGGVQRTGCQFITGLTYRQKQQHILKFTN